MLFLDSGLRLKALSSLCGQTIQSCDETLEISLSLGDFFISSTISSPSSYTKKFFIDEEEFFDPLYDYDFTDLSDSSTCMRGNERYVRPKGWYRMALKVRGKYPDGDAWLGADGWRSHSVSGEWPVSYHGTSLSGAGGIIKGHYKAGPRDMYGRGIYSTPDIRVAEKTDFANTFVSEGSGKCYKVILQNRINPQMRRICSLSDYWLIPIEEGTSAEEERRIAEASLRPYGILIKEL